MICPNCKNDSLSHDGDFAYEDLGYIGEGTVSFFECLVCGAQVEVCVPDETKRGEGTCSGIS